MKKSGVFNERLSTTQDYDLWVRMAKYYAFVHLPEKLIKARIHAAQGSRQETHLKDVDDFYVACLNQLQPEDIRRLYKMKASVFYRKLAGAYLGRNLMGAYRAASGEAQRLAGLERGPVYQKVRNLLPGVTEFAERCVLGPLSGMRGRFRAVVHRTVNRVGGKAKAKAIFEDVYAGNLFGGAVSRSGPGSDLIQTKVIRQAIPELVKELGVKVFMDAPCGDFYWMKETALGVEEYIGVDIVQGVIDRNTQFYGDPQRRFLCLNIMKDKLPRADLIMCRDLLGHLTFDQAKKSIKNFKQSGATYLLTTTFTDRETNSDLKGNGFWRPLNLERPPMSFPKPMKIINENCTEDDLQYQDKSLGLWLLSDISV